MVALTHALESDQARRAGLSTFDRNLEFMVSRVAGARTLETVQMLKSAFPQLRDFAQLREMTEAFVVNDFQPLKRVPIPSSVEEELLAPNLRLRAYKGCFFLSEQEDVVVRESEAFGPYSKAEARSMVARFSAASPVSDTQGHILDPEEMRAPSTMLASAELS